MEAELTQRLVALLEQGWADYLVALWLALLACAAAAAYFLGYLKKAGEQRAINEQLGEIVAQVKAQAQATESVRTEFARQLFESTESLKRQFAQADAAQLRVITAVADLAKLLGSGAHAISWVTWFAAHSPHELSDARLTSYETEMHATLSQIVGARVLLAAFSADTHRLLSDLIEDLYAMDVEVGHAKALLATDRQAGLAALAGLSPRSKHYARRLVAELASLPHLQPIA